MTVKDLDFVLLDYSSALDSRIFVSGLFGELLPMVIGVIIIYL